MSVAMNCPGTCCMIFETIPLYTGDLASKKTFFICWGTQSAFFITPQINIGTTAMKSGPIDIGTESRQ